MSTSYQMTGLPKFGKKNMSSDGHSFLRPHNAFKICTSFQAPYLNLHHQAEFKTAVISNQSDFSGTFSYVSEARRIGLTVLTPDINRSETCRTRQGNTIHVGLLPMKSLSAEAQDRIVSHLQYALYAKEGKP
jgi:DNA polymerase III alpha subunit